MYFSSTDIHQARESALTICSQVSNACIESLDTYVKLGSSFCRQLINEGMKSTDRIANSSHASDWHSHLNEMGHRVLQEHVPGFLTDLTHAAASHSKQLWSDTQAAIQEAQSLSVRYLDRSLAMVTPESFWLFEVAKHSAVDACQTASRASESLKEAADLTEKEVEKQLSTRKSRKAA